MSDPNMLFQEEAYHLSQVNEKLEEAVKQAETAVEKLDREYMDAKRYMADYRGELDPHEMFQNELLLKQTDRTGAFSMEVRNRLVRLRESPYFARIDFQENGRGDAARYYIGKFTFKHNNELLVFDWRAPVSGMFYDNEIGAAGYDAPEGRIEGELTRKRQFKIKDGVMEYALETSEHVRDDILQRELSHTSDDKMKSIISTIQKEQNQIIRNEKAGTLIIQGVAGSGKTSIALHRIAFLLYRFKNQLSARNVTILSPNKVFGDYISNVIPELGEEPIFELGFDDIADIQLEGVIGFEADRDPLDSGDQAWSERVRFKSTMEFLDMLDTFIQDLPGFVFAPSDYTFGRFTADRAWIQARFIAYSQYPVKQRLSMAAEDILARFRSENVREDDLPRKSAILKSLNSMLTVKNSLALYKEFYKQTGNSRMFVMPSGKTLEWADVYPYMYVRAAFEGLQKSVATKHLVIDEMQDYTPVQYAVINRIFPCQKTILGDFGQMLNPNQRHNLEDLRSQYRGAEFVMLNKSYRSTYEIINFAKHIQNVVSLEPVKRHGEEPVLLQCGDEQEEIRRVIGMIREFEAGGNASLGIILKTRREAEEFYNALPVECGAALITPETTSFKNGVSVTSIQMSKGLEFDEVVIPSADCQTYSTEYDRGLLYIACTRAMHKLSLLYTGSRTRLIGENTAGDKGR